MNARRLLAALLMSLVASALFTFWLSKKFAKPAAAAEVKRQYVAATKNLESGEVVQKQNLKLVDWPNSMPLEGGFAKQDDLVGRTAMYPIAAGQPILDRDLSMAGAGSGLATKIPDGMRAISVKSDNVVGVSGFLAPGAHVDVLVTYKLTTEENMNKPPLFVTSIVMQDAEIIAAGQKTQPDPEGKPTTVDVVTLLAVPEDAEKVVLASTQGTVHFVLRNGGDHGKFTGSVANILDFGKLDGGDLSSGHSPRPTPARRDKPSALTPVVTANKIYTVQTVAGDKQKSESFQ